jgi:hypothetical protein
VNAENNFIRTEQLKEAAAKQYVKETNKEMPSLDNSVITIANGTEIVILRDKKSRIVAHYQLLEDYKFFKMENNE